MRGDRTRRSNKHTKFDATDQATRELTDWHVAMHEEGVSKEEAERRHKWATNRVQAQFRGNKARNKYQNEFAAELKARDAALAAAAAAQEAQA